MNVGINFLVFWHPTWAAFASQDAARVAQEGLKRHQKADKKHGFLRIPAGTSSGSDFEWIWVRFGDDFLMTLGVFWEAKRSKTQVAKTVICQSFGFHLG